MPKTCEDIVCPARKRCQPKTLACQWICERDGISPCDGDSCKFCSAHRCLYKEPTCAVAADCPGMQVCTNPGTCRARCTKGCAPNKCTAPYECYHQECLLLCEFQPVLFAANRFDVSKRYETYFRRVKACLDKRPDKKLHIAGHNDEWKFWEYNIHLSLRRARAVREALAKVGVKRAQTCLVGYGMERLKKDVPKAKQSFAVNRRTSFKLMDDCP